MAHGDQGAGDPGSRGAPEVSVAGASGGAGTAGGALHLGHHPGDSGPGCGNSRFCAVWAPHTLMTSSPSSHSHPERWGSSRGHLTDRESAEQGQQLAQGCPATRGRAGIQTRESPQVERSGDVQTPSEDLDSGLTLGVLRAAGPPSRLPRGRGLCSGTLVPNQMMPWQEPGVPRARVVAASDSSQRTPGARRSSRCRGSPPGLSPGAGTQRHCSQPASRGLRGGVRRAWIWSECP